MLHIDIQTDRPWLTLSLIAALVGSVVYFQSDRVMADAQGGNDVNSVQVVQDEEQNVYEMRLKQEVLKRKEDILRRDLEALEDDTTTDPDTLAETRERLTSIIQDEKKAEEVIAQSLREIRDAEVYAVQVSRHTEQQFEPQRFDWPVEPRLGISAHFDDSGYQKKFGMPHHAIDIPVTQGSIVRSVADGVVAKVSDNGMGFNSIVIQHKNGIATLYGHVSAFLVKEGDTVSMGDAIAKSGGTPGTPGAGYMTTGAHLHLQFLANGTAVDPLSYLPDYSLGE